MTDETIVRLLRAALDEVKLCHREIHEIHELAMAWTSDKATEFAGRKILQIIRPLDQYTDKDAP